MKYKWQYLFSWDIDGDWPESDVSDDPQEWPSGLHNPKHVARAICERCESEIFEDGDPKDFDIFVRLAGQPWIKFGSTVEWTPRYHFGESTTQRGGHGLASDSRL